MKHPVAKSVGWALVHAARLHRTRIGERLAGLGLFPGQEQVLQALSTVDTMTMGELAHILRVKPPTASKTIARLAAQGLVERIAEPGDARIVIVRLTEEGAIRAVAIDKLWNEVENELLDGFDNKERKRLRKLLRKAARNLAGVQALDEAEEEADADDADDMVE
ncbi:MAG: MarR family winged helix-turn-helix transcriptional regulator [Pseudochelatococcus sp.]|jgi:DNA-binding MarR family transcriptional regulator|uniref:MarR family winged helix-turn-helix transcriptional regulator n=1 Tax=Pseudochelatococcus sp. TaxID=2020869 RepID=UPI003D9146BA